MTSAVTCCLCSGFGGRSGLEYVERTVVFTTPTTATCTNCGAEYVWSHATYRLRRLF